MKSLILSLTMMLVFTGSACCSVPIAKPVRAQATHYYTLDAVAPERQAIIIAAMDYLNEQISCIGFRPLTIEKTNNIMILHLISVKYLPYTYLGLESDHLDGPILFIAEYEKSINGELTRIDNNLYFKIVLHETAHALGMPASHAFPATDAEQSNLTPKLSNNTHKELYEKDVKYLEDLVCNSKG